MKMTPTAEKILREIYYDPSRFERFRQNRGFRWLRRNRQRVRLESFKRITGTESYNRQVRLFERTSG